MRPPSQRGCGAAACGLEYVTLGSNELGVLVMAVAALSAGPVALAGFSCDAPIEIGAGSVAGTAFGAGVFSVRIALLLTVIDAGAGSIKVVDTYTAVIRHAPTVDIVAAQLMAPPQARGISVSPCRMARTGRPKLVLELTDGEREQLLSWERRRKSSQALAFTERHAWRTRVERAEADGKPSAISKRLVWEA